jgi:hypothetical protein
MPAHLVPSHSISGAPLITTYVLAHLTSTAPPFLQVYIFGGEKDGGELLDDLWEWNVETMAWSQLTYYQTAGVERWAAAFWAQTLQNLLSAMEYWQSAATRHMGVTTCGRCHTQRVALVEMRGLHDGTVVKKIDTGGESTSNFRNVQYCSYGLLLSAYIATHACLPV